MLSGDVTRVVSSEISTGKFPEIYSNLSGNLLITYVNQLFPIEHCKVVL